MWNKVTPTHTGANYPVHRIAARLRLCLNRTGAVGQRQVIGDVSHKKGMRMTDLIDYKARAADHEARARAVADSLRNYLTALNTGGIGAVFAIAGTLIDRGVDPRWAIWPIVFYVVGILLTGLSLAFAKHRELKRRDAAIALREAPDFTGFFWRSYTWDSFSLAAFLLGSGCAMYYLLRVEIVAHVTDLCV